ncbi:outer membrane protein assembly factor BamE [Hahella ganghwensis]|uniref:outer membrane protein assembly factor BamE n=1 Tax=Hahella ganghwensis TaxID=286420 RepID=UPI000376148D|nr:outer membrane protein assembly factor BamE [Hahella ganghwensis]
MQNLKLLFLSFTLVALAGCSFPGVYKIDVQQGNIIEQETIDQLSVGLNRNQVHFIMGAPILESTFDPSYETYLYTIQLEGGDIHRQNITLYYENDILQRIEKREILSANLANPAKAHTDRRAQEAKPKL